MLTKGCGKAAIGKWLIVLVSSGGGDALSVVENIFE